MSYHIPNPKKGIAQLEALIATLTEAKKDQERNELNMEDWVEVHTCGTAACICGYQAISGNLEEFDKAKTRREFFITEDKRHLERIAGIMADDLDNSLGSSLSQSVWDDSERFDHALCTRLDFGVPLASFTHLWNGSGSFEGAIEYMNAVIIKIKQLTEGE